MVNLFNFRIVSHLPTRSGRIRLSTAEQEELSRENEHGEDDDDDLDSNDDELPTSRNHRSNRPPEGGWNRLFDSFLRVGRNSSSVVTRSAGSKSDGIGSVFWGRRPGQSSDVRRDSGRVVSSTVDSIRNSTTSGINTLLERMTQGPNLRSSSTDNLRHFSYQTLPSPNSPGGVSLNLFDLGEEDEATHEHSAIELPHQFGLPSSLNR